MKELWERELGFEIADEDWENVWRNAQTLWVCDRVKATQPRILQSSHFSLSTPIFQIWLFFIVYKV